MPGKRRKSPPEHPIEKILRAASTIGRLEIIAGIDRSPEGRKAFRDDYKHINPPGASLDARLSGTSPPGPTEGRA